MSSTTVRENNKAMQMQRTVRSNQPDMEKIKEWIKPVLLSAIGFMIGRSAIEGISPMLIAYYASLFEHKKIRSWVFVTILLGLVMTQDVLDIAKYICILLGVSIVYGVIRNIRVKRASTFVYMPLIGFLSTLIIGTSFCIYTKRAKLGGLLLESVVVFFLTILFEKGTKTILNKKIEASKETFLSIAVLACAASMGLFNLQWIEISLLEVVALNLLLYVGFFYGLEASAIIGIGIGFAAMYASQPNQMYQFMLWSIMGITVGLFREIGKIGCGVAYSVVYLLLTAAYGVGGIKFRDVQMLIVTIGLFELLPVAKKETASIAETVETTSIEEVISQKLKQFSKTYNNIANKFAVIQAPKERLTNEEINGLMDNVAQKVCADCSMCNLCWQKDFYNTYKTVYSVLAAIEKRGEVHKEDIPADFANHCVKVEEFAIMINRIYDIFKTNLKWENRILEQRLMFSDQFKYLSKVIEGLQLQLQNTRNESLEKGRIIEKELQKSRVEYNKVHFICDASGRKEINISIPSKSDVNVNLLLKAIHKADTNNKYQIKEILEDTQDRTKLYIFVEKEKYKYIKGYAKLKKSEQEVSGDCFTFLDLNNGYDLVALSDGMGSGENALIQSKAAIEMLEELVDGGFELEVAIKMINAVLGIQNDQQAFATLDISFMNRITGEAKFIKNGAVSTFLKRGNKVEVVQTDTLPLGMFKDVEPSIIKRKLRTDDIVIMMSDGVSDTPESKINAGWLEKLVEDIEYLNPQKIAEHILEVAKEQYQGQVADDMTVLVYRVWERLAN